VNFEKNKTPSPRRGYFYVILAALLWGVSGSSSKFLFNAGISPYQLVQLRISIAAGFVSYFFLEEAMEPLQLIGGVLVIASVILLQLKPQTDPGSPA